MSITNNILFKLHNDMYVPLRIAANKPSDEKGDSVHGNFAATMDSDIYYQLDESISNFSGTCMFFLFLIHFELKSVFCVA